MTHILRTSTYHNTASLAEKAILHIGSLAVHTPLNTYKPMEINIERSPQHWYPSEGSNLELFAQGNDALTARPQLHKFTFPVTYNDVCLSLSWITYAIMVLQ